MDIWPGHWQPLGATVDDGGTNFALFSANATGVDLCLFDDLGTETRVPLRESTFHVWHGYVPGVGVGTRYGYRVDGELNPSDGSHFNESKLLADPYARAFDGAFELGDAVFENDPHDSAAFVPKCVVVRDEFDWGKDRSPAVAWPDTVVYEVHVRGFTMQHPDVPPELRGTYAGLAHPAATDYLKQLGVTTIELLPVHHFVSEPALLRRGLSNYWGYNTLGFFAPHGSYSSSGTRGEQVREFKEMVKALHAAGLEIILDVVYNHSAEGDELGPTLSLRGIDNQSYYRLEPGGLYVNYTGCGNTLDLRSPHMLQLVTDSLRYRVTEMHVDGFRFDLAPTLARSSDAFDAQSSFLEAINQDPVLSQVKLIAEPWDVGPGGYQVGKFPAPWTEWNDRFRDTIRDFWLCGATDARELGYRLSGSSDLYQDSGRRPDASLNFVTCHDGFTLHDLVTYNEKVNDANGESNRDGSSDNHNWNCGFEGETDEPVVTQIRNRVTRAMLGTLVLSAGVPMLGHGDEIGRTQRGNNNAYCQDNALAWVDWSDRDDSLLAFTQAAIALRRGHAVFRQSSFFTGTGVRDVASSAVSAVGVKDLAWFAADGVEMTPPDWPDLRARTIGMYLSGNDIRDVGPHGEPIVDDSFLIVIHAGLEPSSFTLPGAPWATNYEVVLDNTGPTSSATLAGGSILDVPAVAFIVLRAT
ncbi:MAG TPA: glycogen debranching protein GlgX [Acidothermaceae bacterium]